MEAQQMATLRGKEGVFDMAQGWRFGARASGPRPPESLARISRGVHTPQMGVLLYRRRTPLHPSLAASIIDCVGTDYFRRVIVGASPRTRWPSAPGRAVRSTAIIGLPGRGVPLVRPPAMVEYLCAQPEKIDGSRAASSQTDVARTRWNALASRGQRGAVTMVPSGRRT